MNSTFFYDINSPLLYAATIKTYLVTLFIQLNTHILGESVKEVIPREELKDNKNGRIL